MDNEYTEIFKEGTLAFHAYAVAQAKLKREGCKKCEGERWIPKPESYPHHGIAIDCPSCIPVVKQWEERAKVFTLSSVCTNYTLSPCDTKCSVCNKAVDPRYSIDKVEGYISIVQTLKDWGLWDRFIDWHYDNIYEVHKRALCEHENYAWGADCMRQMFRTSHAEILTNSELLAQAVISFLKENL